MSGKEQPNMEFNIENLPGGNIIVSISGKLTLENGTDFANKIIKQIVENNVKDILIDMRQIEYVDSFGMGALLMCNRKMNECKGHIQLLMNGQVSQVFYRANLHKVLDIQE